MATQTQPTTSAETVPVTADNFIRAETDKYFGDFVKRGALGKFWHFRELPSIELDSVRPNRDTLYSHAVWDLDAGPATITLPEAGKRFMSMIVIDEEHYVPNVFYGAGDYTLNKHQVGTRYVLTSIRTLFDPNDPGDVKQINALQDAIEVTQPGGPGRFDVPNWDQASHKKVRNLLKTLGESLPDWNGAAGPRGQVDAVRHLIVTATGWGLNPEKDATYLNITPSKNDGIRIYNQCKRRCAG